MIGSLLAWCLEHLNYWVVLLLMILENSLVPLPSELIVTPAAYRAANGEMSLLLLVFVSTSGAVIGAAINYYIGFRFGRPAVLRFACSRWGRLLRLDFRKIIKSERYFRRHGNIATFVGRLIPGLRQFISIPAGLAQMRLVPFLVYTMLGSLLWNCILIGLGYYLAYLVPREQLLGKVEDYNALIGFGMLVIVVMAAGYAVLKRRKRKRAGGRAR